MFIDARKIYNQIDRAHREFTHQQIEFVANIVRLYRGQEIETAKCSSPLIKKCFPDLKYEDVKGLCKAATIDEIKSQNWSLNPGRFVGVAETKQADFDFHEKLTEYSKKLDVLNSKARKMEKLIKERIAELLEL